MTFQIALSVILALLMLVGLPAVLIGSAIAHFRGRGSDRQGSGGISAGIGAAMRELDRVITRPSVEHQVETERRTLIREDDNGEDK